MQDDGMTPYIEHIGARHGNALQDIDMTPYIYIEHIVARREFHVSTLSSIICIDAADTAAKLIMIHHSTV